MQHEPRGFLCHSDCAMNFPRANPVLTVHQHPQRREPFVESDRRVLKDRARLKRELPTLVMTRTLPAVILFRELHVVAATPRASHFAVRPQATNEVVAAIRRISEVA